MVPMMPKIPKHIWRASSVFLEETDMVVKNPKILINDAKEVQRRREVQSNK
jgi:hypothetical protein